MRKVSSVLCVCVGIWCVCVVCGVWCVVYVFMYDYHIVVSIKTLAPFGVCMCVCMIIISP